MIMIIITIVMAMAIDQSERKMENRSSSSSSSSKNVLTFLLLLLLFAFCFCYCYWIAEHKHNVATDLLFSSNQLGVTRGCAVCILSFSAQFCNFLLRWKATNPYGNKSRNAGERGASFCKLNDFQFFFSLFFVFPLFDSLSFTCSC